LNDHIGYSKSRVLASFVVGGLAGAAAAVLLLAPSSGRHTRSSITRRLRDEVARGRTAGARMTGKTREWLDGASRYLGKQQAWLQPQHGSQATREGHKVEPAT
jgi:gas vesicle protein